MNDLLQEGDPSPVGLLRPDGASPFLLLADHAGNAVPRSLGGLGLATGEIDRHIGIDVGILGTSSLLSGRLDATLVYQRYSRLVIDCNRPPGRPGSILAYSDGAHVPANEAVTPAEVARRRDAIFAPYHAAIAERIDRGLRAGRPPVLIAMHSFTPRHGDLPAPRPWHVGVLWNRDGRLAREIAALLMAEGDLTVGLNEPYGVNDDIDYAVPVHAEARGLLHVELEIRQDLITRPDGQAAWADRLARLLPEALNRVHERTAA